ncbi:hypothetical protein QAD02_002746 [Eretmocerus hayati]|uniref:Uncharacterized protein n=1 Tax=Eretmocerus hayati TaxID=131215 RepID=A0ACC2NMP2_9HYME|nr:hypothetical protein QAD02_002746 [Eretmocerus hayati]
MSIKNVSTEAIDFYETYEIGYGDPASMIEGYHQNQIPTITNKNNVEPEGRKVGILEKKKTLKDLKIKLREFSNMQVKDSKRNLHLVHKNKQLLIDFMDFLRILDKR